MDQYNKIKGNEGSYGELDEIVFLHILCECEKMRTRITPNMDNFHAVSYAHIQLIA